jgi:hypothetical protein
MTWELVLQIMALMTWGSLMASPWSPRARRRIDTERNKAWNEVNNNVRKG